jgi:hypothetical protein
LGQNERLIAEFIRQKEIASMDDIAVGCAFSVKETASLLFSLEMRGFIRSIAGKRYTIT